MKKKEIIIALLVLLMVCATGFTVVAQSVSQGASSYNINTEKEYNIDQYKVLKIVAHTQFYEIHLKQGDKKLLVLSKRSNAIGNHHIRVGETYSFNLSRLYYYKRPQHIIVDNDTIPILPNLGIYNKTNYIDYCNERLEIDGGIEIYEADNLNGLYLNK